MNCGMTEEKEPAHSHLSLSFSHSLFVVQLLVLFSLDCLVQLGDSFSFRIKHVENMKSYLK